MISFGQPTFERTWAWKQELLKKAKQNSAQRRMESTPTLSGSLGSHRPLLWRSSRRSSTRNTRRLQKLIGFERDWFFNELIYGYIWCVFLTVCFCWFDPFALWIFWLSSRFFSPTQFIKIWQLIWIGASYLPAEKWHLSGRKWAALLVQDGCGKPCDAWEQHEPIPCDQFEFFPKDFCSCRLTKQPFFWGNMF